MSTLIRTIAIAIAIVCSCFFSTSALSQTAPTLGTSGTFAVLAGSAVTNTGPTSITGDLGVSPGTAITGFPPGVVVGGVSHSADAAALQAQSDLTAAYNNLAGQSCNTVKTGQNLGGQTLTAGVYCFSSSAQLTGTLTLDAQGDANAVFIFQIGSTLTTASNSKVVVINGGSNCNTFWQIGSSAVLGTTTAFAGNILALTSITLNTGATNSGRLLARNGAVTLQSNSAAVCSASCAAIGVSPTSLPVATVGVPYDQTLTAAGGAGPYTFAVTSGTMPPGLSVSTAGVISGSPTSAGSYSFGVTATGANTCAGIQAIRVIVSPTIVGANATPIPTLSQGAIALLLTTLALVAIGRLRRRDT
ncbi:MAG: ice-binding family protein [Rudaea sp.]